MIMLLIPRHRNDGVFVRAVARVERARGRGATAGLANSRAKEKGFLFFNSLILD